MKKQLLSMINSYGFDVTLTGTWAGESVETSHEINGIEFENIDEPKTEKQVINLLLGVLAEINNKGVDNITRLLEVNAKNGLTVNIFPTTPWSVQASRIRFASNEIPTFFGNCGNDLAESAGQLTLK